MAGEISVEAIGLERVVGLTKRLVHELEEGERRGVEKAAIVVERRVKERLSKTSVGQVEFLWVRSGSLRASVAHTPAERDSTGYLSRVGFRRGRVDKYAAVQEFGATINAKSGYLRFPIREGGGLSKAGIVGWVSKKSVTIPARRPLGASLEDKRAEVRNIIGQEIAAGVARATA